MWNDATQSAPTGGRGAGAAQASWSVLAPTIRQANQLLRSLPKFATNGWVLSKGYGQLQVAVAVKVLARDPFCFLGDRTVQGAESALFCRLGREERKEVKGGASPHPKVVV